MTEQFSQTPVCAYYINLDFRADRNVHMIQELQRINWNFQRISAVRLTQDPWSIGIPLRRHLKHHPHVASIFLSHQKALEAILEHEGDGLFVVLEDDVGLTLGGASNPSPLLPPDLPDEWEVSLVSCQFKRSLGENKWEKTRTPLVFSARKASEFAKLFKVTGAHFCLFNKKSSVQKVLERMRAATEIYDIDYWYQENTLCYLWQDNSVGMSKNGGASNHADKIL